MATTITEALADINKVIGSRVENKRKVIGEHIARFETFIDPFAKEEGGSAGVIRRELQSIRDLGERKVELRRAVRVANESTDITVNGQTRTIADWLVWRREVAPGQKALLQGLYAGIQNAREQAKRQGKTVVTTPGETADPQHIVVNLDEFALVKEIEDIDAILGSLDGQLSLKNATTPISL